MPELKIYDRKQKHFVTITLFINYRTQTEDIFVQTAPYVGYDLKTTFITIYYPLTFF